MKANFYGINTTKNKRQPRLGEAYREDTSALGPAHPLKPAPLRKCRKCSAPTYNYYRCSKCHSEYEVFEET